MEWNRKVHRHVLNLRRIATASSFGGRGLKNVWVKIYCRSIPTQRPSNLRTTSCTRHCIQPPWKRRANERRGEKRAENLNKLEGSRSLGRDLFSHRRMVPCNPTLKSFLRLAQPCCPSSSLFSQVKVKRISRNPKE